MENLPEIFFLSKVPEFLHVAFKLMGKQCSVFFPLICASFSRNNVCKKPSFFGGVSLQSFVRTRNKRNLLFQSSEAWLFALVSRSDVTMGSLKFTSIREVSSVAKGINVVCGPVD